MLIPPSLRTAFAIAAPASLAAMITPLLGIVDTAVLARGGETADIAGVALAGAVISVLYWTLGFLRMSMSGLVAQADGRGDEAGLRAHLVQGVIIGGVAGLVLMLLREPIAALAVTMMGSGTEASDTAIESMRAYIEIRFLAAPFAIGFFAVVGWLTGQGRTGLMMGIFVMVTGLNALLDIHFVLNLGWGTEGIAAGTAIAEAAAAVIGFCVVLYLLHRRGGIRRHWQKGRISEGLGAVLGLNRDIFLRTLILALVFAYFTRAGGRFGDITLAANQVLMHIVLTAGLLLDGPAIAAETLVGKALGAASGRAARFREAVRSTSLLAGGGTALLILVLFAFGEPIVRAVIPPGEGNAALYAETRTYYFWAAISPLFMAVPFQLDGIFIGATRGAALRNSMVGAALLFGVSMAVLPPMLGNHGLWAAFGLFMLGRGAALWLLYPALRPPATD